MKFLGWELRRVPNQYEDGNIAQTATELNAGQPWVSQNGKRTTVGEMNEGHARNALGLIVRRLRSGNVAYLDETTGKLKFSPIIRDLVDGADLSYIANGVVNSAGTSIKLATSKTVIAQHVLRSVSTGETITIESGSGLPLGYRMEIEIT